MPQLNSDEAANDEPKTYNDEAIGEEDWRGLNTSAKDELADLKGDLVKDDDVEGMQRRRSYDGKGNSLHNDSSHRHKDDLDRDHIRLDDASRHVNFPYPPQDLGGGGLPSVSGISNPLFPNVILPPSSGQVPFNPYRAFHPLLYGAHSPTNMEGKPGLPRGGHPDMPSMYSLPGQLGQIPNPLAPHWSSSPMYPMCTASAMASMLRYPYPFGSYSTTSGAIGNVSPFPLVPPHPGGLHPTMLQHRGLPGMPPHLTNGQNGPKLMPEKKESNGGKKKEKAEKGTHPYVKKPLNAFMLYMKEQRAKVVAECTLKESAAINQILGRKWHSLNREEQQKYYELARKERQLHMQMFPGWSARDNYGKRKKRKKEKTQDCTAAYYGRMGPHFGHSRFYSPLPLSNTRRKKKCVRYQHDDDSDDDSDGSPYQGSPDGSYIQPNSVGNHSAAFDSAEHSVLSGGASSNSSNQSGSSLLCDRLSPPQSGLGGEIKRENGSPPISINDGVDGKSNNNLNMFHPSSSHSSTSFSSSHSSESSAKRPRKESTKSYPESNSFRPGANPHQNAGKNNSEPRVKRSHSQNLPSPMHTNLFNPMLSPTSMGLNSPHGNPHPAFFPRMQPYLQIAAAASMPASPLGGLMGFTGLGLSSPMNMGMSGAGATPGVHSGSNPSRHATSALEGKS